MRAAVVETLGGLPIVEEFADPTGDDVAEVLAAALNPFDLIVAAGQMPARQPSPPFIAGIEGIARLSDGTLSYFANPRLPYGSLAELVPLAGADTATVPAGLDPAFAAALGVSGIAAWLSLTNTGRLMPGERVLILGAEGQVGQLATQLARLIGAAQVVGAVRADENRHVVLEHGADAAVSTADLDTLTERLREVVGDGVDLILDLVWGPVIAHAIDVARLHARVVQVGNAAGATATLAPRPSCATSWSASCRTPTGLLRHGARRRLRTARRVRPDWRAAPRRRTRAARRRCVGVDSGSRPAPPPASSS